MENRVFGILESVKRDLELRLLWKSFINKRNELIVKVPYDLRETFEVEIMLLSTLEYVTEMYDVYFDYTFHEDMIKVAVLF